MAKRLFPAHISLIVEYLSGQEAFVLLNISSVFRQDLALALELAKLEKFHMKRVAPVLRGNAGLCLKTIISIDDQYEPNIHMKVLKVLKTVPLEFWKSRQNCESACCKKYQAYSFVSQSMQTSSFAWSVVSKLDPTEDNGGHIECFPQELMQRDRSFALLCSQKCSNFLDRYPHWAQDKDFVFQTLTENHHERGRVPHFSCFRNIVAKQSWFDRDFVMQVIRTKPKCMEIAALYASKINSKDFAITICKELENAAIHSFFNFLSEAMKVQVWRSICEIEPWILLGWTTRKSFVYRNIHRDIRIHDAQEGAFQLLLPENRQFVHDMVEKTPAILCILPEAFRRDPVLARKTFEHNGLLLGHDALRPIWSDDALVAVAVKQNGLALEYASDSQRSTWCTVKIAVRNNGLALAFAHKFLRSNEIIVAIAVHQNPHAIAFSRTFTFNEEHNSK